MTKKLIWEWHKLANMPSGYYKNGIPVRKGKKLSKEHRQKIGDANKGKKKPPFTEEHRRKMSDSHRGKPTWSKGKKIPQISGENNVNWKGGVTTKNELDRKGDNFKLWRKAVFARDNWNCQKCKVSGEYLHPHHIFNFAEYQELRFAIDNGITLCKDCHMIFHNRYGRKNNTREQLIGFLDEDYTKNKAVKIT